MFWSPFHTGFIIMDRSEKLEKSRAYKRKKFIDGLCYHRGCNRVYTSGMKSCKHHRVLRRIYWINVLKKKRYSVKVKRQMGIVQQEIAEQGRNILDG